VATGVPIGIGADNVEVMSYGDMARQFCALEVDMAKGNFYELKGCITPNKEPGCALPSMTWRPGAGTTSAGP
jgi:D-alanyl-D-alanine carboxypeptidase/D-alanyl-D-alanine-endopeptidase (penicillin-binding protein 4)